jgi:hypothetical protein
MEGTSLVVAMELLLDGKPNHLSGAAVCMDGVLEVNSDDVEQPQ